VPNFAAVFETFLGTMMMSYIDVLDSLDPKMYTTPNAAIGYGADPSFAKAKQLATAAYESGSNALRMRQGGWHGLRRLIWNPFHLVQ
jgi:hypothetical protein